MDMPPLSPREPLPEGGAGVERLEQDVRRLAESSTDLILRHGADDVCLYASPACRALLGFEPDEMVGRHARELVHPQDVLALRAARLNDLTLPDVLSIELRMRHRDGDWLWVEAIERRVRDPLTWEVIETQSAVRGIAERRREEYMHAQWEEAFRRTSRGIAITDAATGVVQAVNSAFAAMHGGRVEDFEGHAIEEILTADGKAQAAATIENVHAAGFARIEVEHVRLDGTIFPIDAEVVATSGPDGEPLNRIVWYDDLTDRRAAEAEHREVQEMLSVAFADAPTGVAVIGLDARFIRVNAALCALLGRCEEDLVGHSAFEFGHPADSGVTNQAYVDLFTATEPIRVEKRYVRPDGQVVWASTRGIAIRDEHGDPRYIVSHFQDITERRRAREDVAAAKARFEHAFADAPIGMALVALDGRFTRVNRMLCEITGFDEEALVQRSYQDSSDPDDFEEDRRLNRQLIAGEMERYTAERRYFTARREPIWIRLAASLLRDADGAPAQLIVHFEDVTERKRLETSLQRLADDDPLTGLWNRRRFEVELRTEIARCQRYGERAALLMIDLDGFKPINDRHGHKAGDDMLVLVADALRRRLRRTDALARVGGDEFLVLLTNVSPDQAALAAEHWRAAVTAVVLECGGERVGIGASVGIAFIDEHATGIDAVLTQADAAMYDAKAVGRAEVVVPGARDLLPVVRAAGSTAPHKGRSIRVLHGDDSRPYRRLVQEMLAVHPDIDVVAGAPTGPDALAALPASRPDIVLLDIDMPGVTRELVSRLRAQAPQARIVVLSGHEPTRTPLTAAADDFISKTVGFDELAERIRAAVSADQPTSSGSVGSALHSVSDPS
jgi:diguanylate cyclase (GGDEF)-like protein/PAS domain S-box-containing protein